MRDLQNTDSVFPFLEFKNLKHRSGPGSTANFQRSPVLILLFFNGIITEIWYLLYEVAVFGLLKVGMPHIIRHFILWAI